MRRHQTFAWLIAFGALLGCNQADPVAAMDSQTSDSGDETASSGDPSVVDSGTDTGMGSASGSASDGDTDMPPGEVDYYPIVAGATWTYRHTTSEQIVWDEIVSMQEVEWNGMNAIEQFDNAGNNGESTRAIIARDGSTVSRVYKVVELAGVTVETVDYDPGFLRVDNAWEEGDSVSWEYQRTAYGPMGMVVSDNPRTQIFTVESMSVEVTVPAGTFDCIQFVRERFSTGELKRFWFADGVGKVKHETLGTGATEELAEFSIP